MGEHFHVAEGFSINMYSIEMTGNVFDLANALLSNGGIDFARVDCIQAVFTKT
jgi:hypothetical protein